MLKIHNKQKYSMKLETTKLKMLGNVDVSALNPKTGHDTAK